VRSANDTHAMAQHDWSATEPGVRLVVFQHGAEWPEGLACELSGGITTCIVTERPDDSFSGVVGRCSRRVQEAGSGAVQLVWLAAVGGETPDARLKRLAQSVGAEAVVWVAARKKGGPAMLRAVSRTQIDRSALAG